MLKASTLFALLAALMLVIAGAPASASASACNPCPPDCPMMAQMEMGISSADQGHQPDKGGNPCKQGLACASVAVAVPLAQDIATDAPLAGIAALYASGDVGGPTHPPDPGLRPPIQL